MFFRRVSYFVFYKCIIGGFCIFYFVCVSYEDLVFRILYYIRISYFVFVSVLLKRFVCCIYTKGGFCILHNIFEAFRILYFLSDPGPIIVYPSQ